MTGSRRYEERRAFAEAMPEIKAARDEVAYRHRPGMRPNREVYPEPERDCEGDGRELWSVDRAVAADRARAASAAELSANFVAPVKAPVGDDIGQRWLDARYPPEMGLRAGRPAREDARTVFEVQKDEEDREKGNVSASEA